MTGYSKKSVSEQTAVAVKSVQNLCLRVGSRESVVSAAASGTKKYTARGFMVALRAHIPINPITRPTMAQKRNLRNGLNGCTP